MNKTNFKTWIAGKIYEIKEYGFNQNDITEIRDEIDKMVSQEFAKIGVFLDVPEGSEFWDLSNKKCPEAEKIADAIIKDVYKTEMQIATEGFLNADKTSK